MNNVVNSNDTLSDGEEKKMGYRAVIFAFFIAVVLFLIFVLSEEDSLFSTTEQPPVAIGLPAPDFTFPGLDGKMVSLSDYRGKVVFANIWATWCPSCVDEMPSMEKLYQKLKDRNFEILAVSIDVMGRKDVAPFMKKYRLTFPALLDTRGTISRSYRTTGIPESFIIDKEGILVKKIIGPIDWATPTVFQYFNDLIKRPLPTRDNDLDTKQSH